MYEFVLMWSPRDCFAIVTSFSKVVYGLDTNTDKLELVLFASQVAWPQIARAATVIHSNYFSCFQKSRSADKRVVHFQVKFANIPTGTVVHPDFHVISDLNANLHWPWTFWVYEKKDECEVIDLLKSAACVTTTALSLSPDALRIIAHFKIIDPLLLVNPPGVSCWVCCSKQTDNNFETGYTNGVCMKTNQTN